MDVSILKSLPLFAEVDERALQAIASAAHEVSVSEGAHLVDEGDYAYELFLIEEGTASVTRNGETVAQLGPGDFFGEIGLLEKQTRGASVVANTRMRLVTLTAWDLRRLQRQIPEAIDRIRAAIDERRAPAET